MLNGRLHSDTSASAHRPSPANGGRASPDYFERKPIPTNRNDLVAHNCINQRIEGSGGVYLWVLSATAAGQCLGGWIAGLQYRASPSGHRVGRTGNLPPSRKRACIAHRRRPPEPGAGGLVSSVCGLLPLLSQQATTVAGIFARARRTALERAGVEHGVGPDYRPALAPYRTRP